MLLRFGNYYCGGRSNTVRELESQLRVASCILNECLKMDDPPLPCRLRVLEGVPVGQNGFYVRMTLLAISLKAVQSVRTSRTKWLREHINYFISKRSSWQDHCPHYDYQRSRGPRSHETRMRSDSKD